MRLPWRPLFREFFALLQLTKMPSLTSSAHVAFDSLHTLICQVCSACRTQVLCACAFYAVNAAVLCLRILCSECDCASLVDGDCVVRIGAATAPIWCHNLHIYRQACV